MSLLKLVILVFSFLKVTLTSSIDPKSSSSFLLEREILTVKNLHFHNEKVTQRILESKDDNSKRLIEEDVPPGFWQTPSLTQTYFCFNNPESCLGDRNCQEGYSGTLCNKCLPQNSNLLKNKCNECGFQSISAVLNELFLIASPVFFMWCILMIMIDSRNSLDIGRGDSTKRQKLCMLVNNIISYLQDLYLLSIIEPNLPTSLLYIIQPITNSSFSLFGLINCFAHQTSESLNVALKYLLSFGINFALILILMRISFSLLFIKKNISIIFLCVFLLQNLGLVDFALSLLTCREVEGGTYLSIYNMSIECQETSLTARNIALLATFIFSAIIAPWMIIQYVLKRQIRNEEAQTRIKLTLFGTEEELQAQSHISSSWLFVYFNNFGKLILLFLSIMTKSTPTRNPTSLFADGAFVFYYLGVLWLNLKRNINFLKNWQSRLILIRPGITLLSFSLLWADWPVVNSGLKWIISLFNLAYIVFWGTVTIKETWRNIEVFNFAPRVELENFFHHRVQPDENQAQDHEDDDGFGEYQSEDTHDDGFGEFRTEIQPLNSDESEEPELDDEMIAKEGIYISLFSF